MSLAIPIPSPRRKLGTFLGVYTPTVLTILGVIMYLRLGWVLGTQGLGRTILVVLLANSITVITTLSFSAVATNSRLGVGGAYYIVSRSLGLEVGGAVGLPLFLAQAFSVTLYAYGLAESVQRLAWPGLPVQVGAFVVVLLVVALALRGARIALVSQIPILVCIGISLLALAGGALFGPEVTTASGGAPAEPIGFWVVFAVFFPAVTGIMAGLGLSGDLEDPVRAIPRGSLAAVLTGFIVYLTVPLLLHAAADPGPLREDSLVWARIAPLGALLILPGLWGAIFSSAVGSALGAPRTLQALAMDQVAPERLARVGGKVREPVLGIGITAVIALAAVFLGDLDTVATVVTMFFLTIYGTINVVAALETIAKDPSWRPSLRVPWPVSLLGGAGCVAAMFLISPVAALVAISVELLLWLALERREFRADWGDARRGAYEALLRWSLVRLNRHPMTARSWRPHVLVFADEVEKRLDLIRYGCWFSQNRGIVTVCELVSGGFAEAAGERVARRRHIAEVLRREGLLAFPEVDIVPELIWGIADVAQANGIAGLESNTVMLGWPRERERLADFLRVVRRLEPIHKSVIIGRVERGRAFREGQVPLIHVWWGGLMRNGDLMLLLAHLLTRNPEWRNGRIRLMSLVTKGEEMEGRVKALRRLIDAVRIRAEPEVTVLPEGSSVREVIPRESARADVVFLGLKVPEVGESDDYGDQLRELSAGLKTVFFVKNSSDFTGRLVSP
jgi:amino acid transporter